MFIFIAMSVEINSGNYNMSNADCVACFSLTSRWCTFFHKLTILPISPMYTCPQEQGIFYTPSELNRGLWSLGFLKISPIFLGGLKIVWILYLISCQSDLLFLWHIGEWIESFHLIVCQKLLSCLLIILVMFFLSRPFFCKTSFRWLKVRSVNVFCHR